MQYHVTCSVTTNILHLLLPLDPNKLSEHKTVQGQDCIVWIYQLGLSMMQSHETFSLVIEQQKLVCKC